MKKMILIFFLLSSINALAQSSDSINRVGSTKNICICAPPDTTKKPPFYIIDGKIVKGNIYNLNPNDILKITVLKGDSVIAKYGADAVNGVIIIATKSKNIDIKALTNPKGN